MGAAVGQRTVGLLMVVRPQTVTMWAWYFKDNSSVRYSVLNTTVLLYIVVDGFSIFYHAKWYFLILCSAYLK